MPRYMKLSAYCLCMSTMIGNLVYAGDKVQLPDDVASGWGGTWLKSMHNGYKPYGYSIVDTSKGDPVRFGSKAIRFEVRPGDCGNNGGWDDCTNDRERHELSQTSNLQRHGQEHWFAWSIYYPEETPNIYPTKVALGQFHQRKNNVIWMFQNATGGLSIDNQVPGNGRTVEIRGIMYDPQLRGQWNDILVHARWSSSDDGVFRVYVNHVLKYEHEGQNIAKGDESFFKFGIYRTYLSRYSAANQGAPPPAQIVYYDEVRKGSSLKSVDRVGIADVQTVLENEGLYTSGIDGRWGPNTLRAVNAFLAAKGKEPVTDYSIEVWQAVVKEGQA